MEGWVFYFATARKAIPITFLQRNTQTGKNDYDDFVFEIMYVEENRKERKSVQMTRTLLNLKENIQWDATAVMIMAGRCLVKWLKDDRNPLSLGEDNYRDYEYTKFVQWEFIETEILAIFYHFNRALVADTSLSFLDLMISTEFRDVQLLTTMEYLTKRGFLVQEDYYTDFREQRYRLNQRKVDHIEKRLETPKPLEMGENKYYREVDIRPKGDFVFVIMPFGEDEMEQELYTEVIKPTVESTLEIECIRSDEDLTPGKVDDKIYTLIKKAKVVIAEVTTRNPNVFLELGMAQILNKDIISLNNRVQSDENLPFDIRVDTVTFYSDIEELKKELRKALEAI